VDVVIVAIHLAVALCIFFFLCSFYSNFCHVRKVRIMMRKDGGGVILGCVWQTILNFVGIVIRID
jgi:hypothetical protein